MSDNLLTSDVRELGCLVERESAKRLTILEPVSYKAPSIARPYCCFTNTVIFYVFPYETDRNGQRFISWDEVDTRLGWDTQIIYDGQRYKCGGGKVIRYRKGWWMKRWARLETEAARG